MADAWVDTTTPHGQLMVTILGGLAEFGRKLIPARTSEGRKLATARGVKFGRRPRLHSFPRTEAIRLRELVEESLAENDRPYHVSGSKISRLSP